MQIHAKSHETFFFAASDEGLYAISAAAFFLLNLIQAINISIPQTTSATQSLSIHLIFHHEILLFKHQSHANQI